MPRNGSGTYALPEAPFVPNTAILSAEVNSDFDDIADALTGSVASDGQTSITGQIRAFVGSVSAPGYAFAADLNTGMYRITADELGLAAGGTLIVDITAAGISITGTLAVSGAQTFTGAATFASTLGVTGDFAVNTNKFTVTASSGNTTVAGTLAITGTTTAAAINGTAITASGALSGATAAGAMVATQAEMETATATDKVVTAGRVQFNPGVAKVWACCTGGGTLLASLGVASLVRNSAGNYTITFNTAMNGNYAVTGNCGGTPKALFLNATTRNAGSVIIQTYNNGLANLDPDEFYIEINGDT